MIVKNFALCAAAALLASVTLHPGVLHAETTGGLVVDPGAPAERNTREHLSPEAAVKLSAAPGAALNSAPRERASAASMGAELKSSAPVVLATWSGGEFTTEDLTSTLELRRPASAGELTGEQLLQGSPAELRRVVRDLVYEQAIYQKARGEGLTEETPEIAEKLKKHRDDVLNRILFQRLIIPRQLEMDEEAARKYYEENKEKLYTVPSSLWVRALNVPAHKSYKVREGDTLASIAQQVSGDASAVTGILRADPVHFPRLPVSGLGGPVPAVEARPGESLLVPLSRDELTSAEAMARKIRERLAAGADFDVVIQQFPQAVAAAGGQPFEPDTDGMFPELKAAVDGADATTISEVIRTPWGFSVVQIADRRPTETLTFEQAAESILTRISRDEERQQKTNEELRREIFDNLGRKFGAKLNDEALKRSNYGGTNPLTGATPIVTAPEFSYTLDEFLRELSATERTWQAMSYEDRVSVAKSAAPVIRYLFRREAEALGLEKLPAVRQEMESKAIQEIAAEYLRRRQEQFTKPTEAELREFYQQNLDRYTSAPRVTLREITKRINMNAPAGKKAEDIEKARKDLAAVRSRIQSQADFEQAARRESEAISTRSRGGLIGTVPEDFRGDAFRNQIAQLQPGAVSEPFLYGGEMMILRLDKRFPSRVLPFEEVLPQVRRDYLMQVPRQRRSQMQDDVLTEIGFQSNI